MRDALNSFVQKEDTEALSEAIGKSLRLSQVSLCLFIHASTLSIVNVLSSGLLCKGDRNFFSEIQYQNLINSLVCAR